jgi:HAD superfamily hydrolase (TIGR01509 family)
MMSCVLSNGAVMGTLLVTTADAHLFDLDGVVIDSELKLDGLLRSLLGDYGVNYSQEERDRIKPMLAGRSIVSGCETLVREYSLPVDSQELALTRKRAIRELYASDVIDFVPDFIEFFTQLRETTRAPVAIGTGLERETFDVVDRRLGIRDMFDGHVYFGGEVPRQKPWPDIFLHCASQLGVNPIRCEVYEDAPLGIESGLAAGCDVYAITRTFSEEVLRKHISSESVRYFSAYQDLMRK